MNNIEDQLLIFDKWQKDFINEKKVLNMSNSTIMNYNSILNKLYDYYSLYEEKITFYDIDRNFILSFLNNYPNMATNTKNLHITVIKNFFKYVSIYNKNNIDYRDRFSNLVAKAKKSEPILMKDDVNYQKEDPTQGVFDLGREDNLGKGKVLIKRIDSLKVKAD